MTDEELTDAWLRCELGRGITHEEHLRISIVLLRRHGRDEGTRLVADGTLRNCEALDARERFDPGLTARWSAALADALDESPTRDAGTLLDAHPELRRSDLFGLPAWKAGS